MRKSLTIIFILFLSIVNVYAAQIVRLNESNLNLLPMGKEVDGMIGDWVMKNDKVIAVIGATFSDREANQMVSSIQGAIIDFTTLSANNDQLTVYYPQGARVDVPSADTIIVVKGSGSEIVLKVIKYATNQEPYTAETIYTLKDGEDFIHVQTTFYNNSKSFVKIPVFDLIRCDNKLDDNMPKGTFNLAYVNNEWYHSAYGLLSEKQELFIPSVSEKKDLIRLGQKIYFKTSELNPTEDVHLNPRDSLSLNRILLTATDISGLQTHQLIKQQSNLNKLSVSIKDISNKNLNDVFLSLKNENGELVSSAITDKNGKASLFSFNGKYKFYAAKLGHKTVERTIEFNDKTQDLALKFDIQTKINFEISDNNGDMIPVKVSISGINGTKSPNLGPHTRSNGNGQLFYSNDKNFEVPVTAGDYKIIISHGPEYNIEERTITLENGKSQKVLAKLNRAFISPNYIIADLHNHTTRSGDSNAGVRDRVINMVASGVEFAPATEHNRISTYADVIDSLKLGKFIKSAAGIELSGRPGPGSTNHQIAFPLKMQPSKRGYGAPKTDKNPYVQMKRLYDYDNGSFKLMQQNHPEISRLYFDKNNDGIKDKGYGTEILTDVMEIRESLYDLPEALNGGNKNTRSFQWLQMLNMGYTIFGTANTDAHTVGNGTGSIFNYVYTKHDNPEEIDALEVAHQVKKGRLIMSDGPFMNVTLNDSLPGSNINAIDKKVNVSINISQAEWCHINTVNIILNGKIDSRYTYTKEKNSNLFDNNGFKNDFLLNLDNDAIILVMAYHDKDNVGKLTGKSNQMPIALSNPFFINVDGGGFKANGDMLGLDLPVKTSTTTNGD